MVPFDSRTHVPLMKRICISHYIYRQNSFHHNLARGILYYLSHSDMKSWIWELFYLNLLKVVDSTASCCSDSVHKLCPTVCNPMDRSMSGLPVPHHLPEFTQVHIYWIGDAIQLSHPLQPSFPFAFNLYQQQSVFQLAGCSFQVAKLLKL